uniref:(northern house mosquito) hypothetical protein n=1 Tax=Culex pipiens TaxID=7175 RepID=A0A8D8HHH3_CULPI
MSWLLFAPSEIHLKSWSSWMLARSRSVFNCSASRGFISARALIKGIAFSLLSVTNVLNADPIVKRCPFPRTMPESIRHGVSFRMGSNTLKNCMNWLMASSRCIISPPKLST